MTTKFKAVGEPVSVGRIAVQPEKTSKARRWKVTNTDTSVVITMTFAQMNEMADALDEAIFSEEKRVAGL